MKSPIFLTLFRPMSPAFFGSRPILSFFQKMLNTGLQKARSEYGYGVLPLQQGKSRILLQ